MDSARVDNEAHSAVVATLNMDAERSRRSPISSSKHNEFKFSSETALRNKKRDTRRRNIRRNVHHVKDLASPKRAVPIQTFGAVSSLNDVTTKHEALMEHTNDDHFSLGSSDGGDVKSPTGGIDDELERILYLPEEKLRWNEHASLLLPDIDADNDPRGADLDSLRLSTKQDELQRPSTTTTPVRSTEHSAEENIRHGDDMEIRHFKEIGDVEQFLGMGAYLSENVNRRGSPGASLWMTDGGGTRLSTRNVVKGSISSVPLPLDEDTKQKEEDDSQHDNDDEQEYGELLPTASEGFVFKDDEGEHDIQVYHGNNRFMQTIKENLARVPLPVIGPRAMTNKQRRKRGSYQEYFNDADTQFGVGDAAVAKFEQSSYHSSDDDDDGEDDSLFPASAISDQMNHRYPRDKFYYKYNLFAQCRAAVCDCWSRRNHKSRSLFCASAAFVFLSLLIALLHSNKSSNSDETSSAILLPMQTVSPAPSLSPSVSHSPDYHTISPQPTRSPTFQPSVSSLPSNVPSSQPSVAPSVSPSLNPTCQPSNEPSNQPSVSPSSNPTTSNQPSNAPSPIPSQSIVPSKMPSSSPSQQPSDQPSSKPTRTQVPSGTPSSKPTISSQPSSHPTEKPVNKGRKPPPLPI